MKTATIRQVRHDFGTVLEWVQEGEQVQISKRGKVVALISPPPAAKRSGAGKRPDFAGRLKRIFGDQILAGSIIEEERDSRSC